MKAERKLGRSEDGGTMKDEGGRWVREEKDRNQISI